VLVVKVVREVLRVFWLTTTCYPVTTGEKAGSREEASLDSRLTSRTLLEAIHVFFQEHF
jgi:hypothetical protein